MEKLIIAIILVLITFGNIYDVQSNTGSVSEREFSDSLQKNFEAIAGLHINLLLESKINFVGEFDLKKFILEIPTVKYELVNYPLYTQGRYGHRYYVEEKKVYINQLIINQFLSPLFIIETQLIILHETLGALGYNDEIYEISASIIALSSYLQSDLQKNLNSTKTYANQFSISASQRTSNSELEYNTLSPFQQKNNEYYQLLMAEGGGISEGGGGGSSSGALIKANLLLNQISQNSSIELINFFINHFGIEIFNSQTNDKGIYFVCPYNVESFKEYSKLSRNGNLYILTLPGVCKKPNFPIQTYKIIEDFIRDLFLEKLSAAQKINDYRMSTIQPSDEGIPHE